MYCMFCFSFYSVFWRTSTWVSRSKSVSKRWALMVSVQTVSTPCTGPQSEQTTTDSQCPDYSKRKGGIGQQVSLVILDTPVFYMFNYVTGSNLDQSGQFLFLFFILLFSQCLCRITATSQWKPSLSVANGWTVSCVCLCVLYFHVHVSV